MSLKLEILTLTFKVKFVPKVFNVCIIPCECDNNSFKLQLCIGHLLVQKQGGVLGWGGETLERLTLCFEE